MADDFVQVGGSKDPVVPFSDDEVEKTSAVEEEDDDKPGLSVEERLSRKERRNERAKQREAERKQALEENRELKRQLEEVKLGQARLEGALTAQRQAPTQNQKSKWDAALDALEDERKQSVKAAQAELKAGTYDEKRDEHYSAIGRRIEEKRAEIMAEKIIASREPAQRAAANQQFWINRHPEVYANSQAYQWAEAKHRLLVSEGRQNSQALIDEVLEESKVKFKLGGKPAPSASEKDRLSGIPSGGSKGSDEPGGGIRMTKEFRQMAEARFPDLPQAEAHKKWANTTGKKLRAKKLI